MHHTYTHILAHNSCMSLYVLFFPYANGVKSINCKIARIIFYSRKKGKSAQHGRLTCYFLLLAEKHV